MRPLVDSSVLAGSLANRASGCAAGVGAASQAAAGLPGDVPAEDAARGAPVRMQITMSPYYGRCDFSALARAKADAPLDLVSLADLLRNGFVYPPHSILAGVKLVTSSFDPAQDMHEAPSFRFMFREAGRNVPRGTGAQDWVATYHRLLCGAVANSCRDMRSPWLLQSGGKDSTSIAIAAAEARPDMTCITYLGGREENEVVSASAIAGALGLRHETLVCDPARAYDRYLAIAGRMPLLTADFALLSYVDLATEVAAGGGDGIVDGIGSDNYFGHPVQWRHRWLSRLARRIQLPAHVSELPLLGSNFALCYMLATLQMNAIERAFPGSRFSDAEVDALLGDGMANRSKARLALFRPEMDSARSVEEWWAMASSIAGSAASVGKGIYTTSALSLQSAYPFCDPDLREWVYRHVPAEQLVDPVSGAGKVLMRRHIATRFRDLPYVARKGSFRFDLCGLAKQRYDQVYDYAERGKELLPGAVGWLERNRSRLDNKYHASKFYLLAVVLPWIFEHKKDAAR